MNRIKKITLCLILIGVGFLLCLIAMPERAPWLESVRVGTDRESTHSKVPSTITLGEVEQKVGGAVVAKKVKVEKTNLRNEVELLKQLNEYPNLAGHGFSGEGAILYDQKNRSLISNLVSEDREKAIRLINQIKDRRYRGVAKIVLVSELSDISPEDALSMADQIDPENFRINYGNVFSRLAAKDFDKAVRLLDTFQGNERRAAAFEGIVNSVADGNREEYINWVRDSLGGKDAVRALQPVLQQVFDISPSSAFELIDEVILSDVGRRDAKSSYFRNWLAKDSQGAIEWIEEKGSTVSPDMVVAASQSIAESDVRSAYELLDKNLSMGFLRVNALQGLGAQAMSQGIDSVMAWVVELPHMDDREEILKGISLSVAMTNGNGLEKFLNSQIMNGNMRNDSLDWLIARWGKAKPEDAVRFLATTDLSVQAETRIELLKDLAGSDPALAAEQLVKADGFWGPIEEVVPIVMRRWAEVNPVGAAGWLDGVSSDDLRTEGYGLVAEVWLTYDSWGAAEWIGRIKDGIEKDHAILSLVKHEAKDNRNVAIKWANSISDPKIRDKANHYLR